MPLPERPIAQPGAGTGGGTPGKGSGGGHSRGGGGERFSLLMNLILAQLGRITLDRDALVFVQNEVSRLVGETQVAGVTDADLTPALATLRERLQREVHNFRSQGQLQLNRDDVGAALDRMCEIPPLCYRRRPRA